jgi:predicted ATPase/class 3 adenylate cyclase
MQAGTAETSAPASERRYLTIVFVELAGYDRLAEELDPEDLRVLQRRYQNLVLRIMERFGGFVARFSGGTILVYFGYPCAQERDAERAVRASLEVVDRMRNLDASFSGGGRKNVSARVGIHTGLVLVQPELVQQTGTSEHSVFGEVVNVAARIQTQADVDSVALSQETLDLVEGLFEYTPLGFQPIRGLSRVVALFRIDRMAPAAARVTERLRRGAARMVGREVATDRLLRRWDIVLREGRCQIVAIVGEAGVGKTRLMLELCGRPELTEVPLLQLNCHVLFAATPLYLVGSYLRARARLAEEDDRRTQQEKIATLLDEFGMNVAENREIVAGLLGLSAPGRLAAEPPASMLRRRQHGLIVELIRRAAEVEPLVVWIEDAHWLDPSSAEVVLEAVAALARLPALVVVSHRRFPRGPALPAADEVIALEQLGQTHCHDLVRSIPGAEVLSEATVADALRAAEGIPLFVEQLVLSLVEERRSGPVARPRTAGVPLLVAEIMAERLDRRPGGRRIVQAAACIGRSFTPAFLAALLRQDAEVIGQPLQSLVEAEIILPRRLGLEIHFEFRHALLQRMAYESMLQTDRRAMHLRIVELLEDGKSADPTPPEVLAHHLTEAGRIPEAVAGWLRAGVVAARRSAHVEAIEHLRTGLGLLDGVAGEAERRRLELALQGALMGSLVATEGATFPGVSECCRRGLELCRHESALAALPFAFGEFTYTNCKGNVAEAESMARMFLKLAEQGGSESGRVVGHRMLGTVLFGQARAQEAREQFELSAGLYARDRDEAVTHLFGQSTEVHTKSSLSLVAFCLGEIDAALTMGIDALRSADALRHPHSTAIPLTYVGGWVFGLSGAAEPLMRESRRLIALAEQHRLAAFHAHGTANLGWGLCLSGEVERGAALLAEGISRLDTIGFRLSVSGCLGNLADARRQLGDIDGAESACARAIALMAESSFVWLEPELRRIEALIAAARRPPGAEEPERLLRAAAARAAALGFPVLEFRCLSTLQALPIATSDPAITDRLAQLARFNGLAARVTAAMRAAEEPQTNGTDDRLSLGLPDYRVV